MHNIAAGLKRVFAVGCVFALLSFASVWAAEPETVAARTVQFQSTVHGYAVVLPKQQVTVRSGLKGTLEDFTVSVGQAVSAGESVGHIGGPDSQAAVTKARAALAAAKKQLVAAQDKEQSAANLYPKFNDRTHLDDARALLAQAEDIAATARSELKRVLALTTLTSPVDGRIVHVQAAAGDRVAENQPLFQLDPIHELWVEGVFYGHDVRLLDHVSSLQFVPANGSTPVVLHFAAILPEVRSDGGVNVTFTASHGVSWRSGETGEVIAKLNAHEAVAIPTDALILDRGHWWVMIAQAGAAHPVAVTPGPSRGDETIILQGLTAGTPVLVRDAYLQFHSRFANVYTAPD